LMKLQLTRQEATIYAILVNKGAMTGYEVSKISGISRSNTYSALAGLVEKGAAYITEGTSTRYIPVDAGELCDNRIFEIHKIKNFLITNLKPRSDDSEGYITIKGEKHILNKMRNILKNARERAYISVSHKILHEINDELINAVERKIKLVIITNPPFAFPGAIIYLTEKQPEQIRLIADSSVVLTGDIEDSVHSTCLYSKKKNLVDLFKESIKNEIKLIEQSKI
jgi:sugar-specific transcriptional regulator TrmB